MRMPKLLVPAITYASISLVTISAGFSPLTQANESLMSSFTFIPQLAIQKKNLDFSQKYSGGIGDGLSGGFDADLPTLSMAFTTIFQGRYFASLKYEMNYEDSFADSNAPFTNANSGIDRQDFNFTLGMNVWKGLNLFGGYISGTTEIEPTPAYIEFPGANNRSCVGANNCTPMVISNLAKDHELQGIGAYKQTYDEKGWFLGSSYGWNINDMGTLSASAAYALMGGEYSDNYRVIGAVQDVSFNFDGDSKGISLALTWAAGINDRLGYYVDLRSQMYDMDADDKTGSFGGTVSTEETITTLTAGLQMFF
jgi:hypothetical protein